MAKIWVRSICFPVPLSSFFVTPLWWGPSCSYSHLAMLHPWQLLRRKLILVDDDVTGCRVVNVVLPYRAYYNISNVIGSICSGYVPFHSVEFVSQQHSFFRVDRGCVPYKLNSRIQSRALNGMIRTKKSRHTGRFKNPGPLKIIFTKQVFFH